VIVDRYILRQITLPSLAAFFSLNLLFVVVQLLKVAEVAVGVGMGVGDLVGLTVYFLPGFAVFTIPISVLCGVLLGFGRLTGDGELVAFASAGISNLRLSHMPFLLGLVAVALSFVTAAWLAPWSTTALHRAFVDLSKRHVAYSLRPGRFFEEIPGVVLYPRAAAAGQDAFDGFMMYDRRPGRTRHLLVARRARVGPGRGGNFLALELQDGQVHVRDKPRRLYSLASFASGEIGIDIERVIYDRTRFISPTERLGLSGLAAAARDERLSQRERRVHLAAWHRRFAFPLAGLLFALLGCALGTSGRLPGRRRTLLASVIIVAGYYLSMRAGDAMSTKGWPVLLAAWMPDMLVGALAIGLMWYRARRPG